MKDEYYYIPVFVTEDAKTLYSSNKPSPDTPIQKFGNHQELPANTDYNPKARIHKAHSFNR